MPHPGGHYTCATSLLLSRWEGFVPRERGLSGGAGPVERVGLADLADLADLTDLSDQDVISAAHMAEAVHFRSLRLGPG